MLKALEIIGFKSFADRTRLEFPPGITVVVGPNGSGKSNIVDAIKWVLGEQSVKSLRGREMTDVIFNGSGSRRATNAAEITLTLDNSTHLLAIDTPEVYITRRVYRSGEGEYLLNRMPARLRDIRDLISGTGMGSQAYSVIEQGKVDVLLQSSARDRRVVFEEAAGISRFKLRKIEAQRRLERVEQNLLRLSDIVDEVESRLRGVRTQAGKARRYKEYTDRLQELRTQVGLVDWRRLNQRLGLFEAELQTLTDQRDGATAETERIEAELLETDLAANDLTERVRKAEARIAANRERIAATEATIDHQRRHGQDLEQEISRYRRQVVLMGNRADDLQQQWQETTTLLRTAEENHRDVAKRLVEAERVLTDVMTSLDHRRGENEQRRTTYMQQMRLAAALGNETSALESQVAAAAAVRQRSIDRIRELQRALDLLRHEWKELQSRRAEWTAQAEEQTQRLVDAKDQLAENHARQVDQQNQLAELRQRHSGAAERASVLDELVRRHEGLSAGVKEVLARMRAADSAHSPFQSVCGLVADLFHVSVEAAPLVEIALGQVAQHVVAAPSPALLNHLRTQSNRLTGRVGFVWLNENRLADQGLLAQEPHDQGAAVRTEATASLSAPAAAHPTVSPSPILAISPRATVVFSSAGEVDLEGLPGVLGRADRFVETEARFVPLAQRLLRRIWFTEKLSQALELARTTARGLTFVTLAGELLEPDGTLTVGPRSGSSGLISRRSELRVLQTQLVELQTAVEAAQQAIAARAEQIAAQQHALERDTAAQQQTHHALAENRVAMTTAEERQRQLEQQQAGLGVEVQAAGDEHAAALERLAVAREKRRQLDGNLGDLESELAQLGRQIDLQESRQAVAGRETTEIKVELAKSEERLRNLQAGMRQFEESRQERHRAMDEAREHLGECLRRYEDSQSAILLAEGEIANLYLHKEAFAAETLALVEQRAAFQRQRATLTAENQKIHGRLRKLEEKIHAAELAASEVRHERDSLVERMREDYGIDLASLEHDAGDEQNHQREEVQREIEELRQKINNIGNVNLEALDELESLETRHKTLADQYQDLSTAKVSLEKIIDRINADSRRLFVETLETVKGHFQTLFRDLFGGGHADVVLEENVDILECGIEIVARPPGKEPRNISLLSGGEKTLTCVALLLAIFRSRPSPFCVLDEVDAALDEANIDRFTKVIQGFLTWTQFIIVTHSKKTMTCANTIYGVTMQESGVSKQVSVRFEDVRDDGEILPERLAREENREEETQAA
jgi:chromosome segregation protein